uniref:Uncharacterized protein n=1 Tax=Physcomitrium patens TaxID=3218 RepID=A0A2K1K667_PHYPA|nr:hypothetical protein PHYPA_011170 [Physcomitrium patens]
MADSANFRGWIIRGGTKQYLIPMKPDQAPREPLTRYRLTRSTIHRSATPRNRAVVATKEDLELDGKMNTIDSTSSSAQQTSFQISPHDSQNEHHSISQASCLSDRTGW